MINTIHLFNIFFFSLINIIIYFKTYIWTFLTSTLTVGSAWFNKNGLVQARRTNNAGKTVHKKFKNVDPRL